MLHYIFAAWGRHKAISLQLIRKVNVSKITILKNVENGEILIWFANWNILVQYTVGTQSTFILTSV